MNKPLAPTGLNLDEPLLWEMGKAGRTAFSLPRHDVEPFPLDEEVAGEGPDFPDLCEMGWFGITRGSASGISVWIRGCTLWGPAP